MLYGELSIVCFQKHNYELPMTSYNIYFGYLANDLSVSQIANKMSGHVNANEIQFEQVTNYFNWYLLIINICCMASHEEKSIRNIMVNRGQQILNSIKMIKLKIKANNAT